jgi:hypothetical protein
MTDQQFAQYVDAQIARAIPPPPPFGVPARPPLPSVMGDIDDNDGLQSLRLRLHGIANNGKHCITWLRVPMPNSWAHLCLMIEGERQRFWGTDDAQDAEGGA